MMTSLVFVFSLLLGSLALAAPQKAITIGVIADVNGSGCQTKYPANSLKAFDQLLGNHDLDQIIMTGDAVHGECIRYSGSIPYASVVRSMWEEFDNKFVDVAKARESVNIILAPGNHDAPFLTSGSRENFRVENAEFVRYWQTMKPHLSVTPIKVAGVSDNYPYYWAYTYENVLFLVLQSTKTHTLSNAVEQKRWLKAVLQSPVGKNARARIAFGHVPVYAVLDPSVGSKYSEILEKEQVGMPDSLADLLLDNRVDLLLSGHSHAPYPADLTRARDGRRMKVVSMPCGHAPRKLRTKTELAPRGYAVLEIGETNTIKVGIRNYADGKPIPLSYFPDHIPLKDSKATYKRMSGFRAR